MLNPIMTEVTTGATDLILALQAIACIVLIRPVGDNDRFKFWLWVGIFGLLFVASTLGAVAHGLNIDEGLRAILWQPLFLSLGLMLGLIAAAAAYDRWGNTAGRRALPAALVAGVAFYGVTIVADGAFLVFVAYEAVAMLFALFVYGTLARRGQPGAGLLTVGILITLIAAVVQQTDWSIDVIWPFDHNGIFHLIQMPGLLFIALGVRRSAADA